MQLKKIKNFTSIPQSIVYDGNQVVLDANKEQFFPVAVADEFLAECGNFVREVNIAQLYKETGKSDMVYLANMTGNPDAVASVKVKDLVSKGKWGMLERDNPLKEARDLHWTMKGAQQEYQGPEGLEGINTFPTTYQIPRYSRRAFPPNVARWITARDARNEPHYRGQVIESRPVEWAPDITWDLDDITLFLQLCDPKAVLGPTEAELAERDAELGEDEKAIKLHEAKELALQRVHFRISEPKYPLPKKKAFDAVKAKRGVDPNAPVKRGPGRPRKNPVEDQAQQ